MCSLSWWLESGNHVARQSGLEVSPESAIRYHFKVTDSLRTPSLAAGMTWPCSVPPRPGHSVACGSFDNMGADIPQSWESKRPRRKLQCPFHWNPFLVKHWTECCNFSTGLSSACWCLHCYFIPSLREKGLKLPACHLLSSVPFITWLQICSW